MKRNYLIKLFRRKGWKLLRNRSKHDLYTDGKNIEAIPRHPDIKEELARSMIRKWKL